METATMKIKNPKRVAPSKVPLQDPLLYIQMNFTVPGTKLDIRHLWGDFYRLNFWSKVEKDGITVVENTIVDSKFIKVSTDIEGKCIHKIYE